MGGQIIKKLHNMKTQNTSQPEPPEGLSEKAQGIWKTVIAHCKTYGRQTLLAEALRALDRADECRAKVGSDGMTTTTDRTGAVHAHPLLAMEQKFRTQFLSAWSSLNLQSCAMTNER